MANIAIYYQKNKNENTEQSVLRVNNLINQLENHHTVRGVFLDNYNSSTELMEFLNSPLSELDYIYINKPFDNEFDKELIIQLSRAEKFKIKYFDEA
ncbi:MAG: hypothetical protein ACQEW2_17805 [Bacillota bacterium]